MEAFNPAGFIVRIPVSYSDSIHDNGPQVGIPVFSILTMKFIKAFFFTVIAGYLIYLISVALMNFLKDWLEKHIKGTDIRYSPFLIERKVA